MENIKQYLPWIIGGIVLLFILSRLKTNIVPQTTITQTPQPDPYAADRATAFKSLIDLAGIQTQADLASERLSSETDLSKRTLDLQYALGLKSADLEAARINAASNLANLDFLQRENDRQVQQSAIDRFYSARTQSDIFGSINTALKGIFGGNNSGNVFGTPKTFPLGGFF